MPISELQSRSQPPLHVFGVAVPRWLRAWWPAVLWATFIFLMSTDSFSMVHTSSMIEPILRWLLPSCLRPFPVPRRPQRQHRLALDLGSRRLDHRRRIFRARRNPPGIRLQPHRFALRFPHRFHRCVFRDPLPLRLLPPPQTFAPARSHPRTFLIERHGTTSVVPLKDRQRRL